jgi:predicted GNAT family acetyltransferase
MISFKEYISEGQQEFSNAVKRVAFRKHYSDARKKGFAHAAALTDNLCYNLLQNNLSFLLYFNESMYKYY